MVHPFLPLLVTSPFPTPPIKPVLLHESSCHDTAAHIVIPDTDANNNFTLSSQENVVPFLPLAATVPLFCHIHFYAYSLLQGFASLY